MNGKQNSVPIDRYMILIWASRHCKTGLADHEQAKLNIFKEKSIVTFLKNHKIDHIYLFADMF